MSACRCGRLEGTPEHGLKWSNAPAAARSLLCVESITLKSLTATVLDPTKVKLHCAMYNQEAHPMDVLADDWDEWVIWNRWRGATDHFNRQFVFSLAQTHENPALWLFGGVFEVLGREGTPHAPSYEIRLRSDILGPYVKRLRILFQMPGRNARLNLENQLDQMAVESVLAQPYSGRPFPGHDQINHSLAQLQSVVRQNRLDWRVALQHMKGVYVIHDQLTGEPYVGAAYGDTGIWQRLCEYCATLHGHNEGLKDLVAKEGIEYAADNLRFALLEYWSMRTEDGHVLARESYWKSVLLSRTHGRNRN